MAWFFFCYFSIHLYSLKFTIMLIMKVIDRKKFVKNNSKNLIRCKKKVLFNHFNPISIWLYPPFFFPSLFSLPFMTMMKMMSIKRTTNKKLNSNKIIIVVRWEVSPEMGVVPLYSLAINEVWFSNLFSMFLWTTIERIVFLFCLTLKILKFTSIF